MNIAHHSSQLCTSYQTIGQSYAISYLTTNCFRAEVLQQRTVCDRRPVFEYRQNPIVWRRRLWRVGSRQPGSLGRGRTDTGQWTSVTIL